MKIIGFVMFIVGLLINDNFASFALIISGNVWVAAGLVVNKLSEVK